MEDATKGLEGANHIKWTPELSVHFANCQSALKSTHILTIPIPSDDLILTVDASVVNKGHYLFNVMENAFWQNFTALN